MHILNKEYKLLQMSLVNLMSMGKIINMKLVYVNYLQYLVQISKFLIYLILRIEIFQCHFQIIPI